MSKPSVFQWFLRVKGDPSQPRDIVLGLDPVSLGRSSNEVTVTLPSGDVSRRHAEVWVETDGSVLLRDLKSTNGTQVNGLAVSGVYQLRPGDEIKISRWSFEVQRTEVEAKVYKNRLPGMSAMGMRPPEMSPGEDVKTGAPLRI